MPKDSVTIHSPAAPAAPAPQQNPQIELIVLDNKNPPPAAISESESRQIICHLLDNQVKKRMLQPQLADERDEVIPNSREFDAYKYDLVHAYVSRNEIDEDKFIIVIEEILKHVSKLCFQALVWGDKAQVERLLYDFLENLLGDFKKYYPQIIQRSLDINTSTTRNEYISYLDRIVVFCETLESSMESVMNFASMGNQKLAVGISEKFCQLNEIKFVGVCEEKEEKNRKIILQLRENCEIAMEVFIRFLTKTIYSDEIVYDTGKNISMARQQNAIITYGYIKGYCDDSPHNFELLHNILSTERRNISFADCVKLNARVKKNTKRFKIRGFGENCCDYVAFFINGCNAIAALPIVVFLIAIAGILISVVGGQNSPSTVINNSSFSFDFLGKNLTQALENLNVSNKGSNFSL